MNYLARLTLSFVFLAIVAFCVFGFMASYEYSEAARRLPWQLGYGTAGMLCLLATLAVWRSRYFAWKSKCRN